jgi:hypothetical protein
VEFGWSEADEAFRSALRAFLTGLKLGKPPKDKAGRSQPDHEGSIPVPS